MEISTIATSLREFQGGIKTDKTPLTLLMLLRISVDFLLDLVFLLYWMSFLFHSGCALLCWCFAKPGRHKSAAGCLWGFSVNTSSVCITVSFHDRSKIKMLVQGHWKVTSNSMLSQMQTTSHIFPILIQKIKHSSYQHFPPLFFSLISGRSLCNIIMLSLLWRTVSILNASVLVTWWQLPSPFSSSLIPLEYLIPCLLWYNDWLSALHLC